jgi:hypothetical protein
MSRNAAMHDGELKGCGRRWQSALRLHAY